MRNLTDIEKYRGIRVVKQYEDLDIEMFNEIDLVVFLVDEESDVQKAHGLKRENTLIIECFNYQDKKRKAELTLMYIDININGIEYSYIRNQQVIQIVYDS